MSMLAPRAEGDLRRGGFPWRTPGFAEAAMDLIDKGIKARRGHRRLHVAAGGPTGARPAPMPDLRPLIAAQRPAALLSGQPGRAAGPVAAHGPAASGCNAFAGAFACGSRATRATIIARMIRRADWPRCWANLAGAAMDFDQNRTAAAGSRATGRSRPRRSGRCPAVISASCARSSPQGRRCAGTSAWVRRRWDYPRRTPGRSRTSPTILALMLEMARDNPAWTTGASRESCARSGIQGSAVDGVADPPGHRRRSRTPAVRANLAGVPGRAGHDDPRCGLLPWRYRVLAAPP